MFNKKEKEINSMRDILGEYKSLKRKMSLCKNTIYTDQIVGSTNCELNFFGRGDEEIFTNIPMSNVITCMYDVKVSSIVLHFFRPDGKKINFKESNRLTSFINCSFLRLVFNDRIVKDVVLTEFIHLPVERTDTNLLVIDEVLPKGGSVKMQIFGRGNFLNSDTVRYRDHVQFRIRASLNYLYYRETE